MKILLFIGAATLLVACGANGAPLRPSGNVGVSIGADGVRPNASVGATNGTFSVGVGI